MIHYYIEKDQTVIGEGFCPEEDLPNIDPRGGVVVTHTTLPRAQISPTAKALVERQDLLQASDWTQLPDVSIDTKSAWAAYRQELRDITDQPGFPDNIVWPTPPQ
jgi:hypothetical protein